MINWGPLRCRKMIKTSFSQFLKTKNGLFTKVRSNPPFRNCATVNVCKSQERTLRSGLSGEPPVQREKNTRSLKITHFKTFMKRCHMSWDILIISMPILILLWIFNKDTVVNMAQKIRTVPIIHGQSCRAGAELS